jgi:hypothetical protein
VRLAWPQIPKIVCSPSYADIRSRANTTRGLDFDHMIKVRAHKGGMRIGEREWGQGVEMTQELYAHMNNKTIKKENMLLVLKIN